MAGAQARAPCSSRPSGSSFRTAVTELRAVLTAAGSEVSKTEFFPGQPTRGGRDVTTQNGVCHAMSMMAGQHQGLAGDGGGLLSRHPSEACVNRRAATRRCESRASQAEDGHEGRAAGPGRENVGVEEAGQAWGASAEPE